MSSSSIILKPTNSDVENVLRGFRHSAGFHDRVVLDSDAFLVVIGEVESCTGCSWSRSCCPDCCACSGVVVEGRVNEEEDVLVVHGR